MLFIYLQAWLWCLTKSPRIYDSDDGSNYTDSVDDIPSKQFMITIYSPIQSAAHGLTTTLDINGELSLAESLELLKAYQNMPMAVVNSYLSLILQKSTGNNCL